VFPGKDSIVVMLIISIVLDVVAIVVVVILSFLLIFLFDLFDKTRKPFREKLNLVAMFRNLIAETI